VRTFSSPLCVCLLLFAIAAIASNPLDCLLFAAEEDSAITELEQLPQVRPDFPCPTDPNLLFYVQHSSSPNTVVYAADVDADGQLDLEQPVDVYWRRFTNGGARVPLSMLERIFAYGVEVRPQSSENNSISVNIVSYPQRVIKIDFDDQEKPRASIDMGSHHAKLLYVYLEVDDSKLISSVIHVDIFGLDVASGRVLHEVIKP
jgi:hypothetical protein